MIDYEAIGKAGGISKGEPRKKVKARKARADAAALKAFRDKVWKREWEKLETTDQEWVRYMFLYGCDDQWARCQHCHYLVHRGSEARTADAHHRIGRRDKATRYDPDNGVLLCNARLNDCHGKAQRKEIEV